MKRTAMSAAIIGVVTVIAALMWVGPYHQSRQGIDVSAAGNPPVGTAGRAAANEPEESPATLHDLETVTGTVDPHELIGGRVDFHVKVEDINDNTSFWVGNKDNRLLVVHSAPSNDLGPAAAGQMVRITGTIESIQDAAFDDRFKDQKVYIRAEHVTPEG